MRPNLEKILSDADPITILQVSGTHNALAVYIGSIPAFEVKDG